MSLSKPFAPLSASALPSPQRLLHILHTAAATASNTSVITSTTDTLSTLSPTFLAQLSHALGYAVSFGSLVTKLPQVYRVYTHKSVAGLSLTMFGIELLTQTITILFHTIRKYPLSAYGENLSFFVCNVMLLLLYYRYTRNPRVLYWLLISLAVAIVGMQHPPILAYLQSCTIPLYIISRVPQITQNYRTKSTGQLSALTFGSNFLGSCIRIITTATNLGNDPILQSGFVISCICNATILAQILTSQEKTKV